MEALVPQEAPGEEAPAGCGSEQHITPVLDYKRVGPSRASIWGSVRLGAGWKFDLQMCSDSSIYGQRSSLPVGRIRYEDP